MKNKAFLLLIAILALSLLSCNRNQFPASNEAKAEYLERQKQNVDEPTFNDETFDKKSGLGGGHERKK